MSLPDLAYIADVPVEASYHGSVLIYRLLRNYPVQALRIVESTMHDSQAARRLPGVAYSRLDVGARRPLDTRLHRLVGSWYTLRAPGRAARIPAALGDFSPRSVLTVAHGYGWLAAARFARQRALPLHLIVHDDWPRQVDLPDVVRNWVDRRFGEIYRQAVSRFCVSPYMEETYRERYAAPGSVLLPSRAPDAPRFDGPPPRLRQADRSLVFGFGGTINTPGYARALSRLAAALQTAGARLHIYGPISATQAAEAGLEGSNISLRGLVPADRFIERMRDEVDVLFMPISFDLPDRENMRLCFPSKLTDYTAAGLPILAYGPPDASGIRWARANPDSAEIVDSEEPAALVAAIQRLASADRRWALGLGALWCGHRDFAHVSAQSEFFRHLARRAS